MTSHKINKWIGYLLFYGCCACTMEEYSPRQESTFSFAGIVDSTPIRTPHRVESKRLSIEKAFQQLPIDFFLLEGLKGLSKSDKKRLLNSKPIQSYSCSKVGNYLEIMEHADNIEDEQELLEHLTMAVYNSLTGNPIVFISQELIEEKRQKKSVIKQQFLEYQSGEWISINQQLPSITTALFFEEQQSIHHSSQQYIYFDLQPTDIYYLQAHLQHEQYSKKDSIVLQEAYKVAYIWSGNAFALHREAMVQYEIN